MSARVSASVAPAVWQQLATGLPPGEDLEVSTGYVPDDPTAKGYNTGYAAQSVADDGTFATYMPLVMVTGGKARPGTLYAWIRPAGTPQNAPPIVLDSGVPAFSTWRVEAD